MRARCKSDPSLCRKILEGLDYREDGFCKLSTLKPSKEGGYVQVSWGGANKFCVLQELVLWSKGVTREVAGDQCSHLCGKPFCLEHVCLESAVANNSRKGCVVWWPCPHAGCAKKILICQHSPLCIKYVPDFKSWEDFLERGVHEK